MSIGEDDSASAIDDETGSCVGSSRFGIERSESRSFDRDNTFDCPFEGDIPTFCSGELALYNDGLLVTRRMMFLE